MMYQQQQQYPAARPMEQKGPGGLCNQKTASITALVLNTIGGILVSVGLYNAYLVTSDLVNAGYYSICIPIFGCRNYLEDTSPDWQIAGVAVSGVGALCGLIGWIVLLVWLCSSSKTSCMKYTILICICIAWIGYAVALVLWVAKYDEVFDTDVTDLAWGYYMAWIGVALTLASAVVFFLAPVGPQYSNHMMYTAHAAQPVAQPMQYQQPMYQQQPVYQVQQAQPMQMKAMYPHAQTQAAYSNPVAYSGYNTQYNTGYAGYR